MSILRSSAHSQGVSGLHGWMIPALLAAVIATPCFAQQAGRHQPLPSARRTDLPKKLTLVPELRTIPVPHDRNVFNVQLVNAALIPRDKDGIWVLDFAFKPLRIKTVEIPGKGRKQVHYLYYKVTNRTGKPRMFVPEFIMVNEQGQKFHDNVIPQAVPLIQAREDATIPLLGAVNIMGMIPPSTKPDVDDCGVRRRHLGQMGPEVRPVQHLRARAFRRLQGGSAAFRRQADRQVQDAPDRFHPARRRAQSEREGNLPERPALRVGLLVKTGHPASCRTYDAR